MLLPGPGQAKILKKPIFFFSSLEHSEFITVFKGGEELVLVTGWAEGVSLVWLNTGKGQNSLGKVKWQLKVNTRHRLVFSGVTDFFLLK